MKYILSLFLVCIVSWSYTTTYAQTSTQDDVLIEQAMEKVKTFSKERSIPYGYVGYDLQQYWQEMEDPRKKMLLWRLNMAWQAFLEETYYRSVRFEVDWPTAYMYGIIDETLDEKVEKLFKDHDIEEIVLVFVPWSRDDFTNFDVIRRLRTQDIITSITKKWFIASWGVDFLLAWTTRNIEKGARIGVHSWKYDGIDDANALSKVDPYHRIWLDFYRDINMDSEYYWFVLENATATQIFWLQENHLEAYRFRA